LQLDYDKKLNRFTLTTPDDTWRNYPANLIRILLKHSYGMNRQEVTTEMAKAKCVAYDIPIPTLEN
jgi:hypothetical protein